MSDSPLAASAYEVLGVAADASHADLRRAYRQRLREAHPDTGGDAAVFVRVQRAWALVGTDSARAAYDRGRSPSTIPEPTWAAAEPAARARDTRPMPRSHGVPGGWNRHRYLTGIREWAGRGVTLADPYDPALVRSAPRELRRLLADALAEENTARALNDLGMGYTLWHDLAVPRTGLKLDHVVLGPSGLYAVTSDDFGGAVRVRRGELIGDTVSGSPVAHTVGAGRAVGRSAGVRFGGAIVVLPDADVPETITTLGKVKGLPVVAVGASALTTVLRRGVDGVRDLGGTEIFDIRTRLQQAIRLV
ncbi:J domain-containing protein [Microbacterium gorillae]|uniref:J domain-containing protein n=1 Tax=Microbacterium gorillae TaxID=1231063 RepID=UPI00058EA18A|nr:DnaJ domain-containing protein [Microbacterium gorillae]